MTSRCLRIGIFAALFDTYIAARWVQIEETHEGGAGRYGHAAAFTSSSLDLFVSHGFYNLPGADHTPVWPLDTWSLRPSIDESDIRTPIRWKRQTDLQPDRRMGHVMVELDAGIVMHGGDDGGLQRPVVGGGYVPGSYTDSSWLLRRHGTGESSAWSAGWERVQDEEDQNKDEGEGEAGRSLAGHACAAIDGARFLCFGGSIATPGLTAGQGFPVPDSDATWMATLRQDTVANSTRLQWVKLARSGGDHSLHPQARHGHVLTYLSRPAVRILPPPSPPQVELEHSVLLFGGSDRGGQAYGDTWRFVWYTRPSGGYAGAEDEPAVLSGTWQRVSSAPGLVSGPAPREYPAACAVSSMAEQAGDLPTPAMLIQGGAACSPSCTCMDDAWLLVADPVAVLSSSSAPSHSLTWRSVPVQTYRAVPLWKLPREGSGVGGPLVLSEGTWLLSALHSYHAARIPPDLAPAPAPRYRHTLSSQGGNPRMVDAWARAGAQVLQEQATALALAEGTTRASSFPLADVCLDALWQASQSSLLPPLPYIALLHGGESYGPSTYYHDVWLWWEGETLEAVEGGVARLGRRTQAHPSPRELVPRRTLLERTRQEAFAGWWRAGMWLCRAACVAAGLVIAGRHMRRWAQDRERTLPVSRALGKGHVASAYSEAGPGGEAWAKVVWQIKRWDPWAWTSSTQNDTLEP